MNIVIGVFQVLPGYRYCTHQKTPMLLVMLLVPYAYSTYLVSVAQTRSLNPGIETHTETQTPTSHFTST